MNAHYIEGGPRTNGNVVEDSPFFTRGSLAERYLDCLLGQDRACAMQLIDAALKHGLTVRDIYLHIIQPAQYEVGRLWEHDRLSAANEHYCTAISQLVVARLYPCWLKAPPPGAAKAVVTCVNGELHELGARMVADLLEMDGWDTSYLGASTPTRSVIGLLRTRRAELLAISCAMSFFVPAVETLITMVRKVPELSDLKILVGGHAFCTDRTLWQRVGADGCGCDAEEAVSVARALVAPRAGPSLT